MKKYFFILAAAAALAACAKNEVTPVLSNENTEIAYNVAPKTKALDPTKQDDFDQRNVFASWAYYLPGTTTWVEEGGKNADAKAYIANSTISYQSGVWKNALTTYYWPKGGRLTFFAYSLNKRNLDLSDGSNFHCDPRTGIAGQIDLKKDPNTDFLVAEIAKDKSANENQYAFNGVPTLFKHKLTRVVFTVTAENYVDKSFTLNSIQFNNLHAAALYGQYSTVDLAGAQNPTKDYLKPSAGAAYMDNPFYTQTDLQVVAGAVTTVPEANEVTKIYIPQEFADETATITVKYTIKTTVHDNGTVSHVEDNCTKTFAIKDKFPKWEMGKKYIFNLKFTLDEIKWDPAVEKWEDVSSSDITIQ